MTPRRLDADVVGARLRLLAETLASMEELRGVEPARLVAEPLTRAAAERLVQVVADLALDVNAHVAAAIEGAAPTSGRDSFVAVARIGALDPDLAERLAPLTGLRNVLVHRYTGIRVDLVATAIDEILVLLPAYVRQMSAFVEARRSDHAP
ncbi:MAG: DUF86 domain-containing protein [Acidimicrobiales bacterium]|jgi:uncharacterized protein YutE (UPF0331/DUF86 family)|nr:DUF86 domain-containing protein [Acidimicrobiales bacterium]